MAGNSSDSVTLPVLAGQASMWVAEQFGTLGRPYNLRTRMSFPRNGDFTVDEVKALDVCQAMVERHPSLRARLPATRGVPVQVFDRPAPIELRHCSADDPAGEIGLPALMQELALEPIDLDEGPLNHFHVLAAETHVHIVLLQHHCVTDAISQDQLSHDFETLVREQPPGPIDDFFEVSTRSLELERQADSDIGQIVDQLDLPLPDELQFPCEPGAATSAMHRRHEQGLADQLSAGAAERGVTRLALTATAVAAALAPHSEGGWQMGMVATTRPAPDTRVMGCFVNTVPLVVEPSWSSPTAVVVDQVNSAIRRQLSYRHVPLTAWMRELHRRGLDFPTPERLTVSQFPSTRQRLPETNFVKGTRDGISVSVGFGDELSVTVEHPHRLMSDGVATEILDEIVAALVVLA